MDSSQHSGRGEAPSRKTRVLFSYVICHKSPSLSLSFFFVFGGFKRYKHRHDNKLTWPFRNNECPSEISTTSSNSLCKKSSQSYSISVALLVPTTGA